MLQELVLLGGGLLIGAGVVWWVTRRRTDNGGATQAVGELRQAMTDHLDRVTAQVDRRLQENVAAMNESKSFLAQRVSSTERSVREVTSGLARLEQATMSLKATTDEITSFQQLLKNPKVRGGFGEVLLGNLLGEMLPSDRYSLQQQLAGTGEIADAVIKLQDGYVVAIDAKFPLANYERYAGEDDSELKKRLKSELTRDVKKHVTDISKKYIVPAQRTLDFAFMYVPVESVYYDTIMRGDDIGGLWEYCMERKVIPVSPNSFLAYLYTILVGLRGMRIEEQARDILERLRQVRQDFQRFGEDFDMVGKHLNNAKNRFDDSRRRLDKFGVRLDQIEGVGEDASLTEGQRLENKEEASERLPVH